MEIKESILTYNSGTSWPTTTIMVGVHWNELSWPKALEKILKDFTVQKWKVYFIYANIKALEIQERQYQKNMNRCFLRNNSEETYEEQRAKELMPYLEESDYLLDVHNTLGKENSVPFLITEFKEYWKYFDIDYVVSGMDDIHPGATDGFMYHLGKPWFCLESWSIYDSKCDKIAEDGILNFLKVTWNIEWTPEAYENFQKVDFDYVYFNKTMDFRFAKDFKEFEEVKENQIIAYDKDEEIRSSRDWLILFPYLPKNIWDECFCLWSYK